MTISLQVVSMATAHSRVLREMIVMYWRMMAVFAGVFFSQCLFAYEPEDKATIMMQLQTNWGVKEKKETSHVSTIFYERIQSNRDESLVTLTIKKENPSDGEKRIMDFYQGNKAILLKAGCSVTDLLSEGGSGASFNKWTATYHCQSIKKSGMFIFVDADPSTVYLVAYQVRHALLPKWLERYMTKYLNSVMRICYNVDRDLQRNCYQLFS